jgi:cytidine deaminase
MNPPSKYFYPKTLTNKNQEFQIKGQENHAEPSSFSNMISNVNNHNINSILHQ